MNAVALRRAAPAIVILLTLAGFALRLYQINRVPFRGDEVFTLLHWMREPFGDTLAYLATVDPQPPLAIGVYRLWAIATGGGDSVARLLPALLNVLSIPAVFALGARLGGYRMALVAAALWALQPYQVWHSQDARNYAIWATASVMALWLALRALRLARPLDWVLYVVAAVSAAYLYYLEVFVLAALNLYVLAVYRRDRRTLARWVAAQAAIGLVLAPWYLQPRLLSGGGYGGTTGGFQPALLVSEFLPTLAFGVTLPGQLSAWLWPLLLLALSAAAVLFARWRWRAGLLPILLAVVPPALLSLVSLKLNVFEPRYVLGSAPAYVLLAASLFAHWRRGGAPVRLAAVVVAASWVALSVYSLRLYYHDYAKTPDWPALVAYLERHADDRDVIIQAAADEAFNYYLEQAGLDADRKQLPASPQQNRAEIVRLLESDAAAHESIWRVAQTFPDWPNYGLVENWLEGNLQLVRDVTVGGLRTRQYMPWRPTAREIDRLASVNARFGEVAELLGADIADGGAQSGELNVRLYWRPLRQTATALKVSVQLLGPVNPATGTPLWAQDDHEPQHGAAPTTDWDPRHVYRDIYVLPLADVPPGTYSLVVRMYRPETGDRLATAGGSDGVVLEEITLR